RWVVTWPTRPPTRAVMAGRPPSRSYSVFLGAGPCACALPASRPAEMTAIITLRMNIPPWCNDVSGALAARCWRATCMAMHRERYAACGSGFQRLSGFSDVRPDARLRFGGNGEMLVKSLVGLSLVVSAAVDMQTGLGPSGVESTAHMSVQQKNAALRPLVRSATECVARTVVASPRFDAANGDI